MSATLIARRQTRSQTYSLLSSKWLYWVSSDGKFCYAIDAENDEEAVAKFNENEEVK